MLTIFLRTITIYFILILSMRIMGKRQIGELEVSDLVTTLMLSEIATLPIENQDIPLMFAIIPMILLLSIEITSSVISRAFPSVGKLLNSHPNIIIRRGVLDQRELERTRLTIEELLSEVRQSGCSSVEEVDYAILEPGGKITVIPKPQFRPPTISEFVNTDIKGDTAGLPHVIIANGQENKHGLKSIKKDKDWLSAFLKKRHINRSDVLLLTIDDEMNEYIIMKEQSK